MRNSGYYRRIIFSRISFAPITTYPEEHETGYNTVKSSFWTDALWIRNSGANDWTGSNWLSPCFSISQVPKHQSGNFVSLFMGFASFVYKNELNKKTTNH